MWCRSGRLLTVLASAKWQVAGGNNNLLGFAGANPRGGPFRIAQHRFLISRHGVPGFAVSGPYYFLLR
jgi:hypothetical protein